MDHKKKFRFGFVILLGLLFTLLFSSYSECYADVTSDYVQFILDSAYNDTNFTNNNKSWLETYKNNTTNVENLTNSINFYGNIYNVTHNNFNLIGFSYRESSTTFKIIFVLSNCSAGSSNTGFLKMIKDSTYIYKLDSLNGSCVAISLNFTRADPTTTTETSLTRVYVSNYGYTADSDNYVLNISNCYNFKPTQSIYFNPVSKYVLVDNGNFTYSNTLVPPVPSGDDSSGDSSSTGTITNSSGDVTGKVDLTNIENGIGNINQNLNTIENKIPSSGDLQSILSGETSKITGVLTDSADDLIDDTTISSGDITSALNFEIAEDPYTNFWLTLTNNLKTALLGSKRSIDISFQNRTWTISLDEYLVLPPWLSIILYPLSTCFFTFMIVRQWKHIFDKLSSGNVDSILQENSEERYFQFILGGVIMLESLFGFIIKLFFWLIGLIGSIVIYPVQAIIVTLVPSIGEYLTIFLNWTATDLFPMVSFCKEVFLQITCCPVVLFNILITTLFARWLIAPSIRSILLIVNIWKVKSGGNTE